MNVYYEKDNCGLYFLQWNADDEAGRSFAAFLTENGRTPKTTPPFARYKAKNWLAITEAQLEKIKEKGVDNRDERTLEMFEHLHGKRTGETFKASFGSFIAERNISVFVADPDPIIARKQAGDFLDEKARTLAVADGLTYGSAFKKVCEEHSAVCLLYRGA